MRIRLVPVVIFAAALFLTVRIGGLWGRIDIDVGRESIAETATGKPVDLTRGLKAATKPVDGPPNPSSGTGSEDASPDAPGKVATDKAESAGVDGTKAGSAKSDAGKNELPEAKPSRVQPARAKTAKSERAAMPAADSGAEKTAKANADAEPVEKPAASESRPEAEPAGRTLDDTPARPTLPRRPARDVAMEDPEDLSRGDLKILQELAQRRRELEKREQEMAMRDGLLRAAEKRVEEKIAELAKTKEKIEELMKVREEQQSAQMKSLVKIYEKMKPKDAAEIFGELDMTILVEVLSRMKESKSAPILAAMHPKRVQEVTAQLLARRTLGNQAQAETNAAAAR